MSTVSLFIDGQRVQVPAESTILEAAQSAGVHIPTLCHLEDQAVKGNCRICVVEVEGAKTLQPACATPVRGDMKVFTSSVQVREARSMNLSLILSNHPMDCHSCVRIGNGLYEDLDDSVCSACFFCDCVKDGDCELQALAVEYGVTQPGFEWRQRRDPVDSSSGAIERNPNKCVGCRRCVAACDEWQGIRAIGVTQRGAQVRIDTALGLPLAQTNCVECGQCVRSCPVGSIYEKQDYDTLPEAIMNKAHPVKARIEPYFIREYLRIAELDPVQYDTGHLVAGLYRLGVSEVIPNREDEVGARRRMEKELAGANGRMIINACCPAVLQLIRQEYPLLLSYLSKVPSPPQLFGRVHDDAFTLSLSACTARKAEAVRDGGSRGVDLVMSPRELHRLFVRSGVDITRLARADAQGQLALSGVDAASGIQDGEITVEGRTLRTVSASGLKAVREVLEGIAKHSADYNYVELRSCPKGCISANAWLIAEETAPVLLQTV